MHYYQHNIGDYRKDTAHLSLLEHGIYRQLLDSYYLNEKPIETQQVIRRLGIRTGEEHLALDLVLNDFFTKSECGNFYLMGRCDAEISKYHAKADISRVNGSKGGRPKKPRKTQRVILANPEGTQKEPRRKLTNKPLTNKPLKEINKEKQGRFAPPSVSEIRSYCAERKNSVDPQEVFDHYEANGWIRGKTQIKSWKACVRTWEKNKKPVNGSTDDVRGWS